MKSLNTIIAGTSVVLATICRALAAEPIQPPPNAPATVEWNAKAGRLSLRYHGAVILDATVSAEAGNAAAEAEVKLDPTEPTGEKVEQRLKFTLAKPQEGVKLVLRGTATGSDEAFPAETSGAAQKRFPLVRNSVGLSRNLRNNALYDRRWDWLLVGPDDGATRIQPKAAGQQEHHLHLGEPRHRDRTGLPAPLLSEAPRISRSSSRGPIACGKARSPAIAPGGPTSTTSPRRPSTSWWTCSPKRSCPISATSISSWMTPTRSAMAVAPPTG